MTRLFASRRALAVLVLSLAVLLILPCAFAQETTAGLTGIVKDPSGAVIAKATVEVTSPAMIGVKKTQTDDGGAYHLSNLPPGEYTMTITATGFKTYRQAGISLLVGKLPTIDVTLPVGGLTETVEVTGAAPLVDVTQSKVATNIPDVMIENMPRGRGFDSLITWAPGARYEPLQGTSGYQIDGASASENTYLLEGMDTTSVQQGVVGVRVPTDMVQEVQIKTSGFEAEYGGALGGVVNVVTKKGSNTWHGSVFAYYSSDAVNAQSHSLLTWPDGINPAYYQRVKDQRRITEPGFEAGGYLVRDRLWFYSMFKPTLDTLSRTVNFTSQPNPANNGPRTFTQSDNTYWGLSRLDFAPTSKIRLYGSWNYGYNRWQGDLPGRADSVFGDANPYATTDVTTIRSDRGGTRPNSTYITGMDYTVSNQMVITARYGFWTTNNHDFGVTSGDYLVWRTSGLTARDLAGNPVPTAWQKARLYTTIPSNFQTLFDNYTRHGLNVDGSYYARFGGAHNFKFGYYLNRLANDVDAEYFTSYDRIYLGATYTPYLPSGDANCAAIDAANGGNGCRGNYGYWIQRDYSTIGKVSSNNQSLYGQDSWTLGRLTLNLGIRFDKEYLPSYASGTGVVSNPISFGWTQKVAPRLGGAYDILGDGKLKVYASYGMFYDIMKYEMPRGSFGGDYWRDCAYTLDVDSPTAIHPVKGSGPHLCPGAASGVPGTFIEMTDWRIPSNSTGTDNRIDPNLKPMRQHEMVGGVDWALKTNLGLEARYSRKRLDRTIEDNGIMDPTLGEAYFIANPGEGIVAHPLSPADCGTPCPVFPKAIRNYDGLEIRLTKKASGRWWGSASYTYSRLFGNYGGLTSTDEAGRHSPNVNRYFDLPHLGFDAHGKWAEGPLATDRPHTLKLFGFYDLKYKGMSTTLGLSQYVYSGTPMTTEVNVISSTPMYVENRGNWANITFNEATGAWSLASVTHGKRTPMYTQTDLSLTHQFKLSKTNEALKASVSMIVTNLLNQTAAVHYYSEPLNTTYTGQLSFDSTTTPSGYDWHSVLTGFNWVATANAQGAMYDLGYGLADTWQDPRSVRFQVKFTF